MRIAGAWAGVLALVCWMGGAVAQEGGSPEAKPKIQIALLLDTSGSMDGLIDQAKSQLWNIVNQFVTAKREGTRPTFEVALYEYGKSALKAEDGYIRQIVPLTDDLDKVSQELFALTTNGGDEYCGQVIGKAAKDLAWSKAPNDLKAIFIAGNEPFSQGPVDYRKACKTAIEKGITVSTIFCGPLEEGERTGWKDGSLLADGTFAHIDQNRAMVQIEAPQDVQIATLNSALNETYIAYGKDGQRGLENQVAQDKNAQSVGAASSQQRFAAKSSAMYCNWGWDLVDACNTKNIKLEDVKDDDLPESMKKMSLEERKRYLDGMAQKRGEIQKQIQDLSSARAKYVAEELKKRGEADAAMLDQELSKAAVKQAEKLGFSF